MSKNLKRILFRLGGTALVFYLGICVFLYVAQENIIFHPYKLSKDFTFSFPANYEELDIEVEENIFLNALLFKTEQKSNGLVFYLHGNARSIRETAWIYEFYTSRGYDFMIMDYRGYGKSDGENENESQMMKDVQVVYDLMKQRYDEDKIIVKGYSLGTGIAAKLAATNQPARLILVAPYYSLKHMAVQDYPLIPTFILKYPFLTFKHLKDIDVPVNIFHGKNDRLITSDQSVMLAEINPEKIDLELLDNCGHHRVFSNMVFRDKMKTVLDNSN